MQWNQWKVRSFCCTLSWCRSCLHTQLFADLQTLGRTQTTNYSRSVSMPISVNMSTSVDTPTVLYHFLSGCPCFRADEHTAAVVHRRSAAKKSLHHCLFISCNLNKGWQTLLLFGICIGKSNQNLSYHSRRLKCNFTSFFTSFTNLNPSSFIRAEAISHLSVHSTPSAFMCSHVAWLAAPLTHLHRWPQDAKIFPSQLQLFLLFHAFASELNQSLGILGSQECSYALLGWDTDEMDRPAETTQAHYFDRPTLLRKDCVTPQPLI